MGERGIPQDRGFDCRLSMEDRGFDCSLSVFVFISWERKMETLSRPNGAIVSKLIFLGCKPKPVFILPPMLTPNVPIIVKRNSEFFIFRPWLMPQGRKRINIGFKFCMCWSGRDMDKARN